MSVHEIDPDAVLDFQVGWTLWLAAGETIVDHTVVATDGITVLSSSVDAGVVTLWVGGGVAGTAPVVACHIVTSAGRQDDRSITLFVRER